MNFDQGNVIKANINLDSKDGTKIFQAEILIQKMDILNTRLDSVTTKLSKQFEIIEPEVKGIFNINFKEELDFKKKSKNGLISIKETEFNNSNKIFKSQKILNNFQFLIFMFSFGSNFALRIQPLMKKSLKLISNPR
jgi:hypothetical protein